VSAARGGLAALDARFRRAIWRAFGATEEQTAELVAYAASPAQAGPPPPRRIPLLDAPCVEAWQRYCEEAHETTAAGVLRRVLVQLRFPVEQGMSDTPAYQAATRRGVLPSVDEPAVPFADPEGLRLFLHPTPAGRVPVVLARAREDFETLVQAVSRRNEPDPVPPSMGACMIAGYNNWDRVAERRRAFEREHPDDWGGLAWAAEFRELLPRKELYQDRFMLLSSGPYSSTPAAAVDATDEEWRAASIELRLEHECTHYFMREAFGAMRKSLLDELVADYMGLSSARGSFRADYFLRFMGLESYPRYREGGRLQNYRGTPPLSDGSFAVLPAVVKRAAESLERLDPLRKSKPYGVVDRARVITAFTRVGLEGLASEEAEEWVGAALDEAGHALTECSSGAAAREPIHNLSSL
jgi:hypothetical protein